LDAARATERSEIGLHPVVAPVADEPPQPVGVRIVWVNFLVQERAVAIRNDQQVEIVPIQGEVIVLPNSLLRDLAGNCRKSARPLKKGSFQVAIS